MENLTLVKAEHFGEIEADIYSNGEEMFMTINQLAACLEYSGRDAIEKIVKRNPYLTEKQFSDTDRLSATDGKQYETRIFTEDGIYEVTMLSKHPKAREFRAWIRGILKALRKGEAKIVPMTDYQKKVIEARERNLSIKEQEIRAKKAKMLKELSQKYAGSSFEQVLDAYATKELEGEFLLPLPNVGAKTYSAEEIGEKLGISANMVGRLVNRNGLKTNEYGEWFKDKSRNSQKEVSTFRYFENVIPVIEGLLSDDN